MSCGLVSLHKTLQPRIIDTLILYYILLTWVAYFSFFCLVDLGIGRMHLELAWDKNHPCDLFPFIKVQAIEMYGAAQPDFLKPETNGGIKNIISYYLKIIKRCVFSPNFEGVAQKISLPRP